MTDAQGRQYLMFCQNSVMTKGRTSGRHSYDKMWAIQGLFS